MNYAKAAEKPRSRERSNSAKGQKVVKEEKNALSVVRKPPNAKSRCEPKVKPNTGHPILQTESIDELSRKLKGTSFSEVKPSTSHPILQRKSIAVNVSHGLSRKLKDLTLRELTIEEKKEKITNELNKCESPFIWKPKQGKPVDKPMIAVSRLQKKDEEIRDVKKFKWRNFILQLVISYELYNAKKESEALEKIKDLEKILQKQSNCKEWLFTGIQDALWHVIYTSKAFLCVENNLIAEAYKIMDYILPVKYMKLSNRAGVHGIKAAVFMEYGHKGNILALEEAMEAVKIDKTNAEWHFLIGKSMGRIRRVSQCYELVDPLEVKAFNEANNYDKVNPYYKVYLAQALRERAFREFKKNYPKLGSEGMKKLDKIYCKAKHLFFEVKKMQPDCPHLLMRCAYGMLKLPDVFVVLSFVRECIDRAIELAPENPMAHHVKGLYNERFNVDANICLEAYKKAADLGNFGAAMDLVKMHYKLKQNNIVEELESIAAMFEEKCKLQVVYMQAGSYLLFIKKDIVRAVQYYQKVVDMDPESYAMKVHKPMFIPLKDPLNMFDVLLEELNSRTGWKSFSPEENKILRKLLITIRGHESLNNEKRLSVEQILKMSINYRNSINNSSKKRNKRLSRIDRQWRGKKCKGEHSDQKYSCDKKEGFKVGETGKGNRNKSKCKSGRVDLTQKYTDKRTSSNSSVDSDYQRNSMVHGPRNVIDRIDNEHLHNTHRALISEHRDEFSSNSRIVNEHSFSPQGRSQSRDSSICSISSDELMDGFGNKITVHNSRYFQSFSNTNKESNLTVENVQKFNSTSVNDLTGRLEAMSVSSRGSDHGSLSVMERVKQSYRMLSYKSNYGQTQKQWSGVKSGSSQSLNKNREGIHRSESTQGIHRSESTQSLDIQKNVIKNRFSGNYKPAYLPRDSSVDSTRSLSFMPNFASKSSDSITEN